VETTLVIFLDYHAIVHHEFVPAGQTVNEANYKEVLKGVRDGVQRKLYELWTIATWHLHHNNAPSHMLWTRGFLAEHSIPVHP
jgi:hypothetical protein